MKNSLENTRIDAMLYADIPAMPDKWDGETCFKRALAKVTKTDGNQYYCIVRMLQEGNFAVVKDFSPSLPVYSYDEIYPYEAEVEARLQKKSFSNQSQRYAFIRENGIIIDGLEDMSAKELDEYLTKYINERNNG